MSEMTILVLFFSFSQDRMNARSRHYRLPGPMTLAEFFDQELREPLREPFDAWMFSVNQEWAGPDHILREGDEVAVIPPVSGG